MLYAANVTDPQRMGGGLNIFVSASAGDGG
jgi:hypothetical protein